MSDERTVPAIARSDPLLQRTRCSPFLQGQLTSDVGRLDDRTQLAACATPQGRVIAILRLVGRDDGLYALLPAALASTVIGRLRKFVLRAKARIDARRSTGP